MKKVKKLWMPLLLGVLLMSTLVGVASARPNARPEASPALVNYTFSAHHCVPEKDTTDWSFGAFDVRCDTSSCGFYCPIKPPYQGLIRVQRLALYAWDNAGGDVCISLDHVYPKTAGVVYRIFNQCTTNNPANPQVLALNPANFKVSVLQDISVGVSIPNSGQMLYGFKLKYEPL